MGIREAPRLFVMNLVVFGKSEGGAGFQGQRARCFWRGLGWKVEGYFLFVKRLAWCVCLCVRVVFQNRPQGLFIFSLCLSRGWSVQMSSYKDRVGRDCTELQSVQTLVAAEGGRGPEKEGKVPVLPQHCTEAAEEGLGLQASPGGLKAYRCDTSCQPPPLIAPRGVFPTRRGLRFSGVAQIQGRVAAFPHMGPPPHRETPIASHLPDLSLESRCFLVTSGLGARELGQA